MLPLGRALALTASFAACSLQSTDALNRCEESPQSADCAAPVTAGGGGTGGDGGSGLLAGSGGADGGAAGAEGGAGGAVAGCEIDAECPGNLACIDSSCEPGLRVLYAPSDLDASTSELTPSFIIQNDLAEAVPFAELKLRYYYTLEQPDVLLPKCYLFEGANDQTPCIDELEFSFMEQAQAPKVDHYFELGFVTDKLIDPNGKSSEMKVAVYKEDFTPFDQSNDYSFAEFNELTEWDHVTLYRNGELVWGVEP